jgi:hypothetical protein
MSSQAPNTGNASQPARIGSGTQPPRGPLIPRWVRLLLYPVFATLLMIPALRRLRRDRRRWNLLRLTLALAGLAATGLGTAWSMWWLVGLGGVVAAAALLIRPSADPDRERDLQRRHHADYLLNGGKLASPWPAALQGPVARGAALHLLVRGGEILFVPVEGSGEVRATIDFAQIRQILVNGESYRPVYISEAKDPPVREQAVNKKAVATTTLLMEGGERVDLEYEGAFSKHLAESAAHAIYSVRQLGTAHGVGGESPEIFHIVGR